jgi:predicted amidohydrolase YtcJ
MTRGMKTNDARYENDILYSMKAQPSFSCRFGYRWVACALACCTSLVTGPGRVAAQQSGTGLPPADLVLLGGRVITLDQADRITQAIAIRANRILAVGTDDEINRLRGPNTRAIDLRGRAVTPGFIDSHTHAESTAEFRHFWVDLHSPPLPAEHSSRAILEKLRERVSQAPRGTWVVGQGPFGPQVPPTMVELTVEFPEHPVVVKYGMHQYVANRKALEMAGINRLTPDPPGGKIERGQDGEPTGMLYECFELFPIPYPREELKRALETTLTEDFLKQGVTTVYELSVTQAANGLYQELHDEGRLPVRLHIGYMIYPALQPVIDFESILKMGVHSGFGDDWLRIGPAKLFVNGAGNGVPLIRRDQAALNNAVLRLHHAGWQLWLHAIGGPAQDMALEALENALLVEPRLDARHRIEHIGTELDQRRFDRMKRAGIIPVPTEPGLPFGPSRDPNAVRYPYHTMLAMGFQPPGNSDTGGSYSWQMNVISRLAMLVTRATENGGVDHPEEAVAVTQALRILSTYGAHAGFEERTRGMLEPGKLADFVVLSNDPLSIAPEHLKDLKVDATIIDGIVRYERSN